MLSKFNCIRGDLFMEVVIKKAFNMLSKNK